MTPETLGYTPPEAMNEPASRAREQEQARAHEAELTYAEAMRSLPKYEQALSVLEDPNQSLDIKLAYTTKNQWQDNAIPKTISDCIGREIAYLRNRIAQCERAINNKKVA